MSALRAPFIVSVCLMAWISTPGVQAQVSLEHHASQEQAPSTSDRPPVELVGLAAAEYWDAKRASAMVSSDESERQRVLGPIRAKVTNISEWVLKRLDDPLAAAWVTTQWWTVMADCWPGPIPWDHMSTKIARGIDPADVQAVALVNEQARELAESFAAALDRGRDGRKLSPKARAKLAHCVAEAFRKLTPAPVSDAELRELEQDAALFTDIGLPPALANEKNGEMTLRWYVWLAIVQPKPGPVERSIIDGQVNAFCRLIEQDCEKDFACTPNMPGPGAEAAKEFQNFYDRTKDNRWVPYFKRAWTPMELEAISKSLTREIAGWGDQARPLVGEDRSGVLYAIRTETERLATENANASHLCIPGESNMAGGGWMNTYGIYEFSVDAVKKISQK